MIAGPVVVLLAYSPYERTAIVLRQKDRLLLSDKDGVGWSFRSVSEIEAIRTVARPGFRAPPGTRMFDDADTLVRFMKDECMAVDRYPVPETTLPLPLSLAPLPLVLRLLDRTSKDLDAGVDPMKARAMLVDVLACSAARDNSQVFDRTLALIAKAEGCRSPSS